MELSDFVVSEWFWAAAAVAVAVAALVGSVATFIGGAIIRRVNRPEPEWDVVFHTLGSGTQEHWDGYVGNSVTGRAVNIGDGTAFQVRLVDPSGEKVRLNSNNRLSEVVPVVRTGDSIAFTIITGLDHWEGADSVLSWIDPPTRRGKGGQFKLRPYLDHAEPERAYRNMNTGGEVVTEEEWLSQGGKLGPHTAVKW